MKIPENEDWRYTGETNLSGEPHGQGVMEYHWYSKHADINGRACDCPGCSRFDRYEGQWKDGKRHGFGVFEWWTGDRYEGQWRRNSEHGAGVFTSHHGGRYEGQWKDGQRFGQGVETWPAKANPSGMRETYEGPFRHNYPDGKGVLTFEDGTRDEGTFLRGQHDGLFHRTTASGEKVTMRWRKGRDVTIRTGPLDKWLNG